MLHPHMPELWNNMVTKPDRSMFFLIFLFAHCPYTPNNIRYLKFALDILNQIN